MSYKKSGKNDGVRINIPLRLLSIFDINDQKKHPLSRYSDIRFDFIELPKDPFEGFYFRETGAKGI